jgi:uncharacterized protein (TIGR00725 family)
MTSFLSDADSVLFLPDGRWLDSWAWEWHQSTLPDGAKPIDPREAVRLVFRSTCRGIPVAVIGPKVADKEVRRVAGDLGHALGSMSVPILCGGRGGVMEAAAKGALTAGGLTIGFLPEDHWQAANDYIAIPLAMGIGPARNVLIAQAALALVAVGGRHGTHSEAAFGLHFDKPVFGLCGAPDIDGMQHMQSVDAAIEALIPILLRLPSA